MELIVSAVNSKDGKTFACLRFEEGNAYAEGIIPDCKIEKTSGFSSEEINMLENYMKENLSDLKKQAAKINPIKTMIGK